MTIPHSSKIFGEESVGSNAEKIGEAVSSTTTYYSTKVPMSQRDGRQSVHIGWTGTPTGTLTLWYSNLDRPNEATDADWVQDTTWAPGNPAGSAGATFVPTGNLVGKWWRVRYVNASGSGTLWAHAVVAS